MKVRRALRRLVAPLRWRTRDREMREEMAFHLEAIAREYERNGITPVDARRQARRRFGSPLRHREVGHDARGFRPLSDLATDIRHAARGLRQSPAFALVVILMLGFGLGAANTVFTFVNAILLRELPFDQPDQIVWLGTEDPRGQDLRLVSKPDFDDVAAQAESFSGLSIVAGALMNVTDEGHVAEQLTGTYNSANMFSLLGVRPLLGRDFEGSDDTLAAAPVVILSYNVWAGRYRSDPAIVGRKIRVNSLVCTIVGVMPPRMLFPQNNDLWLPWSKLPPASRNAPRQARNFNGFGRLGPGATLGKARAELDAIGTRLAHDFSASNTGMRPTVQFYKNAIAGPQIRGVFSALMGAVVFVLLIACANVANLLMARASRRSREVAVRLSLGAGRWRIVRQLLVEGLMLSFAGGVLGLLLSIYGARAADRTITAAAGPAWKPYWMTFTLDGRVFAFLAAICVVTGIVFGLAPALHLSATRASDALKEAGGRTNIGGMRSRRWTSALLIAEVSLTLVLLSGAGFMMRTFLALYRVDLHVTDSAHLFTMRVNLPLTKYPRPETRLGVYARLEKRLGNAAEMQAALTTNPPISGGLLRDVAIEGHAAPELGKGPRALLVEVSTNYFGTVGTPLMLGRALTAVDEAPGQVGVVVNERFAALNFANEDPIGRRIRLVDPSPQQAGISGTPIAATVVGVTATVPQTVDALQPAPVVYLPYAVEAPRSLCIIVRAQDDGSRAIAALREDMRAVDSDIPLYAVQTLDEIAAGRRWTYRVFGAMFAIFAALALVLSALGLYAITSYAVSQRTPEISVRLALGATAPQVMWLVLERALRELAVAVPVGIGGALAVERVLRGFFIQIPQHDSLTVATMTSLMIAVALAACLAPARRATRLDPALSLREQSG